VSRTYARLPAIERAFIEEYLVDLDPVRAALAVGYTPEQAKTAALWVDAPRNKRSNRHRELMNAPVRIAVEELLAEQARRAKISGDRCVDELKKLAFSNLADFVKESDDGTMVIDLAGKTRAQMSALSEIITETTTTETTTNSAVTITTRHRVKIKLWDKMNGLVHLMKHFGVFEPESQIPHGFEFTLNIDDKRDTARDASSPADILEAGLNDAEGDL
jgi:hypothetical protein